jgi:DNA-binding CsgD family transcriptional regulator
LRKAGDFGSPAQERDFLSSSDGAYRTPTAKERLGGNPTPRLSDRQKEIVRLLAQGRNSRKIAEMLGISQKTVETHRRNIMFRTNCRSTGELVRYAIRNRIIEA